MKKKKNNVLGITLIQENIGKDVRKEKIQILVSKTNKIVNIMKKDDLDNYLLLEENIQKNNNKEEITLRKKLLKKLIIKQKNFNYFKNDIEKKNFLII